MSRMIRLICTLCLAAITCAAQTSGKKRVAVLDFDYGTVQSYVSSDLWQQSGRGERHHGYAGGKISEGWQVFRDRAQSLDKILAEQNFSNSDRANPATAAKIGQILGVDAIIMGSITKFGRDDHSKSIRRVGRWTESVWHWRSEAQ